MTTDPTADILTAIVIWACWFGTGLAGYWLGSKDREER